jgi:hypothetical protein
VIVAKGAQPDQIKGIDTETQGAQHSLGGVFYIVILHIMSISEVKKEIEGVDK